MTFGIEFSSGKCERIDAIGSGKLCIWAKTYDNLILVHSHSVATTKQIKSEISFQAKAKKKKIAQRLTTNRGSFAKMNLKTITNMFAHKSKEKTNTFRIMFF